MSARSVSIRTKFLLLFTLALIVLSGIVYYASTLYKNTLETEHTVSERISEAVHMSHETESTLNLELNAWKNILLRGNESNNYHRYLQEFYSSERKARKSIRALHDELSAIADIRVKTEQLITEHKQMGRQLRVALRIYNDTKANPGQVTDQFVAGLDETPIRLLREITDDLQVYRMSMLGKLAQDRMQQEKYLFVLVAIVLLIFLASYLWLVDRNITLPAERARYLADVINNAQRVAKFGTWDWESAYNRHYWSDGLYEILGMEKAELPSQEKFLQALHEDDRERTRATIDNAIRNYQPFELEARVQKTGNIQRVVQQRGEVKKTGADGSCRMTSIIYDITKRTYSEKRLEYLANYDTLTGLPNRNLFQDRLRHAMAQADRHKKQMALLYLDLDHFKSVNDALGHQAGDELLVEATKRIKHHIRESDTAARLGGDEFTIVLEQLDNHTQVTQVAENLLSALNKVYKIDSHEVFVSASMGITFYPSDGKDVESLLQNADSAMYLAKERGRDTYYFFTEELNKRAQERLMLENSLRMALDRDEFQLHFQPQVELETGRIIGAEALLRWSPQQDPVSPERFIPVLEETGLIVQVGKWVLEQACMTARGWQNQGFRDLRIAVNLSARQLRQVDITEMIKSALESSQLPPELLEVELTESTLIDENISKDNLRRMEQLGLRIAIDDFGTGYSSLSYLKQYSVDILKVDRSFINDITHDSDDDAVTSAIIALSHQLNMKVIAEGIETPEQYNFLRKAGCDQGQGFFIGRPMINHQFEQWMQSHYIKEQNGAYWSQFDDSNEQTKAV
jgi:diguanylate cyclase (GGDEF)-like protein/PAS domain S-box-containing protein